MITLIDTGWNITDVDAIETGLYMKYHDKMVDDSSRIKDVSIYVPVRGASPSLATPPALENVLVPWVWEEDDTIIQDTLSLNFIQVNEI